MSKFQKLAQQNETKPLNDSNIKKVPTTIISTPLSTCILVNSEISQEYTNFIEGLQPNSKFRKLTRSTNFERTENFLSKPSKNENLLSRPQTSKNSTKKQNILKFHSPKSSSNFEFLKERLKTESQNNKSFGKNAVDEEILTKLKEMMLFSRHDEIIKNLIFFENMKNACKLNFYSVCEGGEKTSKTQENEFNMEDIHSLILVLMKKLESEVKMLFLLFFVIN